MGLLSWLRGGRGADRPTYPPAPASTPAPPAGADRFDVVELPPIQRTLTAPALLTDPSAFERGLPTRQPTALSSPLGHLVSAEAPSGVVDGVTTPVQRSVVRFPVRGGGSLPTVPAGAAAPAPTLPPVQRDVSVPASARVPSAPVREASGQVASPAIQRSYEPPVREVSSAGTETAEFPSDAADGPDAVDPGGSQAVEAAAESSVRPLVGEQPLLDTPQPETAPDAGQGPAPVPVRVPGTALPPVQRSLPPAGTPRPATPAPRRAPGLGAPLPALPPTAQRTAAHTSAPVPAPPPSAAAPFPVPSDSAPPPLPTATPTPAPAPEPEPVAPLLADRPLVLRTVAADAGPAPAPPSTRPGAVTPPQAPGASPAVVPVRWETPSPAVHRGTLAPLAATTVQRVSTMSPAARPAASSVPIRPIRPIAPISSAPARDAGDVAVAAGIAQRMADGSVVFAPPPPVRRPASPAPFVQREVTTEEPSPPRSPPEDSPTAAADPAPDPPAESPSEPGAATPHTPSGTPPVTDEFVRALYPSLARLFKAELRLERERAGRLIDTRF
ncbi:hypothetical protein ACFWIN_08555 [Streptomyces sp. NPDC127049]|uniref:hypothetical protein n=1 Tax=Streptomyces sp. NPDC127049 TaxID=3347118 RepID=UPI00365EAEAA